MIFYDRVSELEALESEFESEGFSFFVVYGRRRVGKTELIKQFCRDKDHVYHLFSQDTAKMQRERLVERIADSSDDRVPKTDSWREAVEYIGEKLNEKKNVLALDEFQYIIESDESVVSQFQYLIDEIVDSDSMLIVSGSTVSIIENQVLGYDSPLYGRRTGQIDLKPFSFGQSLEAIDYGFEEAVESFTVTGGTPLYLTSFDYSKSLDKNIREKVLNPASTLFEEPEFLLRQELRNPSRYMSILESIANGYTTANEISNRTGIQSTTLNQYLNRLKKLRLIKRQVPVTASGKSKRSIYKIKDGFIDFWFRSIAPRKSEIEQSPEKALESIRDELKHQSAETFEKVCREAVKLETEYLEVGRWWYGEEEIDVAAVQTYSSRLLLGEVKWTSNKVGKPLLEDLERKQKKVRWKEEERDVEYVLFSRKGFSSELENEAEEREDLKLYGLERLETIFESTRE